MRCAVAPAGLLVCAVMTGCATLNPSPQVDLADTRPVQAVPTVQPPPNNGSIFQMAQYRPLFEDHRARLVGDTLTINIVEKVSASQSSNSSVDRSGSLEGALKAVPLVKSNPLDRASISGTSTSAFAGKGATENTNDFSGVITVIVTGVLPNGHLQIAGEKQIGVYGAKPDRKPGGLWSVQVWEQTDGRVVIATDRIGCSPTAPMRITGGGGQMLVRELNPGGAIHPANRLDHLIWWAVCHPQLAGRDPAALAAEARRLGYSGQLQERQQVLRAPRN